MKFRVYGLMTASKYLGEYEAESKEEALRMLEEDDDTDYYPNLCHHCAKELDIGEVYDFDVWADKE